MRDLRDAVRALRTSPLVSAVAVLSLALGIGANTALFSILNGLLLKPLPVADPHTLVLLASSEADEDVSLSYEAWQRFRERRLLDRAFAWSAFPVEIRDENGGTAPLEAIWASGEFFDALGVPAARGRTFGSADDRRDGGDGGPVAVISHGLWQRRFGADASVLGRTLTIERVAFTIVGVAPAGFHGLNVGVAFDVALPLETQRLLGRAPGWLTVMGRLPSGRTLEQAAAALRGAYAQIREQTMPDYKRAEDRAKYLKAPWTAKPGSTGTSTMRSRYAAALVTLLSASGLVLLVACANVGNLLLARAAERRYEWSVRLALGASRGRLACQLLVESLLLAVLGTAGGLALAQWGGRLLVAQLATWFSTPFLDLSPDWQVLALCAALTVTTTIVFGSVPALRAAATPPIEALNRQGRGSDDAGKGFGGALVVVQVAVSLVLVVGAGLFLRSFAALAFRDLGLERDHVVVAIVNAKRSPVTSAARVQLYQRLSDAAAAVPGADSAAVSLGTPLGSIGNLRFSASVRVLGSAREPVRLPMTPVSPGWFHTFGTRVLAGRDLGARDRPGTPGVAIVNQAFARRYFDGTNPLGRSLVLNEDDPGDRRSLEIVGLVEDAAFSSVREPASPMIYPAFAQAVEEKTLASWGFISIIVRAARGSPDRLTRGIAAALEGVDPAVTVKFLTLRQQLDAHYIRERLLALLSGFFGALALLLAALGLYGTTAHAVGRRRAEIGIRMALGADRARILRLILRRVAFLSALGIAVGALASLWAGRFIGTLLFQLEAGDPTTFATSAVVLLSVAGLAAWLPARRAARLEPAVVLRQG